jgi:hypothetical protein
MRITLCIQRAVIYNTGAATAYSFTKNMLSAVTDKRNHHLFYPKQDS